ncbi:M3 family metallopeptidase [Facilibium subflavum]|uniref:M3 family metallopeptidase n=1 Tax=Facilibium subflavum TaxID=2219058 RepID=UPI000E6581C9|nr:M3 family metallopeptidase [Facilibium subflavum]
MSVSDCVKESDLPCFSAFDPDLAAKEVDLNLVKCRQLKESLLETQNFTWQDFIYKLDEAEDKLSQAFGPIAHLNAVKNTPKLREVYQQALEKVSEYMTESSQDKRLLNAYQQVLNQDKTLDFAQKKAIEDAILDFKLSGIALADDKRQQFKEMSIALSKKQSEFENNVLDATMAWQYCTKSQSELEGLSQQVINAAFDKAKMQQKQGYVLGLDGPTYLAVMQQADNRQLRQKFYQAYTTRASSYADDKSYDNTKLMQEILNLRQKKAQLLGMENYAEVSLETKMAKDVDTVEQFLHDLLQKAKPQAKQELETLQLFANAHGLEGQLKPWDVSYYSEKLKKHLFDFTEDELRPYFPLSQVLKGLFDILAEIYGIKAIHEPEFDRYEENTQLYAFYDADDQIRGKVLIDLFARKNKRDGAWMDECQVRYKKQQGEIQLPVAYVTCNFMPPEPNKEALLTHNEVLTLFHEFGHALHHILTQVDYLPISGINGVEWDAVELPSQFMENFCWQPQSLALISKHITTGQPLQKAQFEKLLASRKFQSAMMMVRQLEFALFDMALHKADAKSIDVHHILTEIRKDTALIDVPEYNRFENSFAHIFAGGYAAGYYSYKWAEVLSSDAFAMFEETGDILDKETGKRFLTCVLEKGGAQKMADLFFKLRGRAPEVDALLKHSGIG